MPSPNADPAPNSHSSTASSVVPCFGFGAGLPEKRGPTALLPAATEPGDTWGVDCATFGGLAANADKGIATRAVLTIDEISRRFTCTPALSWKNFPQQPTLANMKSAAPSSPAVKTYIISSFTATWSSSSTTTVFRCRCFETTPNHPGSPLQRSHPDTRHHWYRAYLPVPVEFQPHHRA